MTPAERTQQHDGYELARVELVAAVDRAKHLCLDHGITTVQQVHGDPGCHCTIQYLNPEDVKMMIIFECPRHGKAAQFMHDALIPGDQ